MLLPLQDSGNPSHLSIRSTLTLDHGSKIDQDLEPQTFGTLGALVAKVLSWTKQGSRHRPEFRPAPPALAASCCGFSSFFASQQNTTNLDHLTITRVRSNDSIANEQRSLSKNQFIHSFEIPSVADSYTVTCLCNVPIHSGCRCTNSHLHPPQIIPCRVLTPYPCAIAASCRICVFVNPLLQQKPAKSR